MAELSPSRSRPKSVPQPTGPADQQSRLAIEVLDGAGRAMPVEFVVRPTSVEVWSAGRRSAVLDRGSLAGWLARPAAFHGHDDLIWARTSTGVALTITHAFPWWELAPRDLRSLRELVGPPPTR